MHFLLLKLIASKPDGWYMICEDDINFDENHYNIFKNIRFFKRKKMKQSW
jgi:GR25 family glycosyltransferase involved in LPS biosynthesis